ncbi:MAG: PAS domain-containing sensor histidine kinase [Methylocystis sp.]|nr:MAG: PAS domain-containing sensor histidine kinase [Methylocystis sp.]
MSGSQVELDGSSLAAARIAADPAFSALDASGAPLLAASGEPLRIVYLNPSARAVFGEDVERLAEQLFFSTEPGARRLAQLVESVRHGAALRLERLRFDLADAPQTVTILCRKLTGEEGAPCFVIAALGVRPATAPDAEPPSRPVSVEETGAARTRALRERLAERHGALSPRFLWKTDAAGRFVDVTQALADVAGAARADILGRTVGDVVRELRLDPSFARAIESQKSWSGIEVDWPLDDGARAPVTLGALPTSGADRRFAGFQGYGVMHLSRAYQGAAPSSAPAAPPPPSPQPGPAYEEFGFSAPNVVQLRPPAPRQEAQEPEAEPDAPAPAVAEPLTTDERMNFEEIARALRAGEIAPVEDAPPPASQTETEAEVPPAETQEDEPPAEAATLDEIAARLAEVTAPAPLSAPAPPPAAAPALNGAPLTPLLDCLPVGVLVARGAQTLFANRTLLDYLGYRDSRDFEADGGLARMFFGRPPADAGARAAAIQSSEGEALDVDLHLQSVDWDGAPATLVTLRRNRSRPPGPEESALALARERDEKLARARADNSLLRAILETSGETVAVVDDDGRIESATGAFAALFGAEKGAFDGLPLTSLFSADEGRLLAARIARIALAADAPLRLTARVGGKAFDATLRRLGPAQKLCVSLREAGALERNDELAAARDAAEQANAAKSDFLARISHEIRTPLNAIIGFAEVMMEERFGPIGSERYKDYLKDVHASGALVLSLVNDLLDLSKIEAGKLELEFDRVDANAVIAECASIMQTQANQEKILMRLALADRLPPIRADRRSLKQILLNLLSNAMKFNEPGGQVIVSSALTDAGYVVIRVKDTGIGMSDDEVLTALEPFKQIATAHKKPGTGLGLPLTKALIEANQASFTIKSRKKEGTLIEIAFPPPQVLAAE